MSWTVDADGRQVCPDCTTSECRHGPPCDISDCHCGDCQERAERARALDDRPDAALRSLARDLEAERVPTVDELRAERFGRPSRGAA